MPAPHTYDYAVVRVVPRVERGEFVNVGVIVCCAREGYLDARIEVDESRLLALDPLIDLAGARGQPRGHSGDLRRRSARPDRSAGCRSASASTGSSRRAAR